MKGPARGRRRRLAMIATHELERNMKKRPQKNIPKTLINPIRRPPNSDAAKLLKESGDAMGRISNLATLLLVVDLSALTEMRLDYHEPVSHAFRAFGEVLSDLAMDARRSSNRVKGSAALTPSMSSPPF